MAAVSGVALGRGAQGVSLGRAVGPFAVGAGAVVASAGASRCRVRNPARLLAVVAVAVVLGAGCSGGSEGGSSGDSGAADTAEEPVDAGGGDVGVDPDPDSDVIVTPLDPDGLNVVVTYVWGRGRTSPPSGEFVDVAAASWMSCGVRVDGSLACWPDLRFGEGAGKFGVPLPDGEFTQVVLTWGDSSDLGGGCALRVSGELTCWSDPQYRRDGVASDAPSGRFADIRAMFDRYCAVRLDGGVVCWGQGFEGHEVLADSGYVRMTDQVCALDVTGGVGCRNERGLLSPVVVPGWVGALTDYHWTGSAHCGIRAQNHSFVCWDGDTSERVHFEGIGGDFVAVEGSADNFCITRVDGAIDCHWDVMKPSAEITSYAPGEYVMLALGAGYSCAIRIDRTLACWGDPASESSIG